MSGDIRFEGLLIQDQGAEVGVLGAGMSTYFFLWATAVYLTVFRDVEVIADALEASTQMAGLKVFQRKVTRGFRG